MAADAQIIEAVEQILEAQRVAGPLAGTEGQWPGELWQSLEQGGFTRAWGDESQGGSQASWYDGLAIAMTTARFAVPLPVVESLMCSWVCRGLQVELPVGPLALVVPEDASLVDDGTLVSSSVLIPFGPHINGLLVSVSVDDEPCLALVDLPGVPEAAPSLAGEPAGVLNLDNLKPRWVVPTPLWSAHAIECLGATLRCFQIAGALADTLARSVEYAGDRQQFGRAIAKFQAVQHNLAVLAGESAAATGAANAAAAAVEREGLSSGQAFLAVASAKIRCGQAATEGSAIAHQVHGAMGFAREYPLHRFTRRLWQWRDDYGSEAEWAERLGQHVVDKGVDEFWPMMTA